MTAAKVLAEVLRSGGRIITDAERPRLWVPAHLKSLVVEHRAELRRLVIQALNGATAPAVTSARMDYAFPWPDAIPGLGARHLGVFTHCHDCLSRGRQIRIVTIAGRGFSSTVPIGTWTFYGRAPLCLPCAQRRAST